MVQLSSLLDLKLGLKAWLASWILIRNHQLSLNNSGYVTNLLCYLTKRYFLTWLFNFFLTLLSSSHAHNLKASAILNFFSTLTSHMQWIIKSSSYILQNCECLFLLFFFLYSSFYHLDKHCFHYSKKLFVTVIISLAKAKGKDNVGHHSDSAR